MALMNAGSPEQVADAEPGHGVGLGETRQRHRSAAHIVAGRHRQQLRAVVNDLFVDLVGNHDQPEIARRCGDAADAVGAHECPGWVAGIDQHQDLGAVDAATKILGFELEAQVAPGGNLHDVAAGRADRLIVRRVTWIRGRHPVAGIHQRQHGQEQRFLPAVGDDDLGVRIERDPLVGLVVARDRPTQLGQAPHRHRGGNG